MEEEGLPYSAARNMSYNSRLAQELAKWAETKGAADQIHDPIFRAYFVDLKNIGLRFSSRLPQAWDYRRMKRWKCS